MPPITKLLKHRNCALFIRQRFAYSSFLAKTSWSCQRKDAKAMHDFHALANGAQTWARALGYFVRELHSVCRRRNDLSTFSIGVTKPPYKMVHSFLYKMQIQGAFYNGPCWQILLIPALNSFYKRQLVGDTLDRDHIFKVIWYLAKHVVKILFGIMMEV